MPKYCTVYIPVAVYMQVMICLSLLLSDLCVQANYKRKVSMTLQEGLATQPSSSTLTTATTNTMTAATDSYSHADDSTLGPDSTFNTANSSAETSDSQMVARKQRTVVKLHVDIISDSFWEEHPDILGTESS